MTSWPPFTKVLIANRGEIAVRIIHACRELGIASLAVYSQADAGARHARMADEALDIGPAAATDSYLRGERLIAAARAHGADAIHPGYGFLAENADFAKAVIDAGLRFIGPPPQAIRAMGDKAQARSLMEAAGVPVVPGYQGSDQSESRLLAEAGRIGYPLMVKAAAGGGGKGMRIAHTAAELPEALAAARREAAHAFGDDRLILERYIANGRHIEIQVLADQHGHIVHLNERECSIQRRHQKIIEEAPSPYMNPELRANMGAAAVAAAEAVGYTNAGTVEFIVDPQSGDAYFLEMNTRLQVEHPVTELTTGLDLVAWQMRIAAGAELPPGLRQPYPPCGHAIECRLYAEDPAHGFLPDSGPVLRFIPPAGPGIRVDSGIATGDTVSTHYDPLLAKIIVHAEDRPAAIRRMQKALRATALLGLHSNLAFLQAVLAHPRFQAGDTTTRFIAEHLPQWQPPSSLPIEVLIAAALATAPRNATPLAPHTTPTPWQTLTRFRIGQ